MILNDYDIEYELDNISQSIRENYFISIKQAIYNSQYSYRELSKRIKKSNSARLKYKWFKLNELCEANILNATDKEIPTQKQIFLLKTKFKYIEKTKQEIRANVHSEIRTDISMEEIREYLDKYNDSYGN